jgi:membrane protein DedA with SNARE-associated domain
VTDFIVWVNGVPSILVYASLAAGAAVENILPAVPADTFVALGGLLAGAGDLDALWLLVCTWVANVSGALVVYRLSYAHGPSFFDNGWGRYLVRRHQMERMARFYERWGLPAIFFSRFLPGVRAVVPVFAGATRQPAARVALPLAAASAIWYGGLVWLGVSAGQNLETLSNALGRVNLTLAVGAGVVTGGVVLWWVKTRHRTRE